MTKTKQKQSLSLQYILKRHPELADTTILHPAAGDTRTALGVFLQSHRKSTAIVDNKKKWLDQLNLAFLHFIFYVVIFLDSLGTNCSPSKA